MHTKRTIALIGDDVLIKELATALTRGNNRVLVFSRSFETAKQVVTSIQHKNILADIEALPCSYNASWEADIIITSVPYDELKEIAAYIKDVAIQKIFIVAELVTKTDAILNHTIEIQNLLPHTKIVKVTFNIYKDHIAFYATANKDEYLNIVNDLFFEAGIKQQLNSLLN